MIRDSYLDTGIGKHMVQYLSQCWGYFKKPLITLSLSDNCNTTLPEKLCAYYISKHMFGNLFTTLQTIKICLPSKKCTCVTLHILPIK